MRFLIFSLMLATSLSWAEFPTSQPYPAVRYQLIEKQDPPNRIHVLTIDLSDPSVMVRTTRSGEDPDGDGPYQTSLNVLSNIADREGLDLAVNGDFFSARQVKDANGKIKGFTPGDPAKAHGPVVTDGVTWALPANPRPALVIGADGHATIGIMREPPKDARQVIAGSTVMLKDSKPVAMTDGLSTATHPRTAVGLAEGGRKLVIVVDDGRWKEHSMGMTLPQLAEVMKGLGCEQAINLDGGGSSEMLVRDPATGSLVIINHPCEGHERPVANVLGIRISGTKRKPPAASQPTR